MSEKTSQQLSISSDDRNATAESSPASATSAPVTQVMDVHHQHSWEEDIILVWLDPHIDELNDNCLTDLTLLRTIVNFVKIFTNSDECIDFVTNSISLRVFIIVSETVSEQTISLIHGIPQLNTIFILSTSGYEQKESVEMYPKVKGIYTQMTSIYEALKLSIDQYDQDSISISFISTDDNARISGLDQLDSSFLFTQILTDILLSMKFDIRSMEKFVEYCRSRYNDDEHRLKVIDEFEHTYRPDFSVSWYTRDSVFYQVINRASRTLEFGLVIRMGFFIRDLYREIERLHAQQFGDTHETLFTVYRGQGLSNLDFEKLKKTKGNLMSFNNFLSTSKDRAISLKFAEDALTKPGMVGILFKMIIDPSNASVPFACINNVSNIKDEGEILFSIGSVYRINEIEKIDDNDRLYQVELKLTSSCDQQLRVLVNWIKEETYPATEGWHRMGMLLIKLHHYSKAKELYETVLQQTTDEQQKGHLYHMLGIINNGQGNYTEAIEFFENSIKANQTTHPLSQSDLAASYNNIGLVYDNMEDYSKALAFYEKALEIRQKILPSDHPHLANSYDNVGGLYCKIGDYPKALSFCEKTLVIRQKILPPNHPELATSYNNIGLVYENMGEHSKALEFHEKALEIKQQSLPSNDPHLVSSYDNIGLIYNNMGQYSNALSYYQKALDIVRRTLPENHLYLATGYACHGSVYNKMGEYLNALSSYEKALEIWQKTLPANHFDLVTSNNNIGEMYCKMSDYPKALCYFNKALEIQQKILPPDHHKLTNSYKNIARAYFEMEDPLTALSYYDKVLEIEQRTIPPNPSNLAVAYNDISSAYSEICDYSRALLYCDKALEIEQNIFPSNHPIVITTYNNIGLVYNKMGYYLKALSWLKKTFDTQRIHSSSDDLLIAETYSNMGRVYNSMKDFLNAVSYYKKTLKIQQKILSANDLLVATTYSNIGQAHAALENYAYALSYYQNALKIQQKVLSANNPSLAETYNNMGEMYQLTGDYAAALSYYEKNLDIQEQILPLNHPSLATSYYRIGQIHCSKGDYERALTYLEKTLEIQSQSLPPNHLSLALSHFNIASVLKSLNRNEECIKHVSRAVLIASQNTLSGESEMQAYRQRLNEYLVSIISVDVMKKVKNEQWTYPVLLILMPSQEVRLYSIFNDLTDGHLMASASVREYETKIKSNKQIKSLVVDVSSISSERRDHLLGVFSSIDHIESIYLLGKSPEISKDWSQFFTQFPKVCMFCEDEKHLAVRWVLDMANACRMSGNRCNEEGDRITAREHFQRGVDLYERLRKFIGATRSQMT